MTRGRIGHSATARCSTPRPENRRLRRTRRRQRQYRIDRLRVARGAQLLGDVLIAQQPRDPRQRLQGIGARAFRRQQQEHEVHRLAVHRLEIDRAFEPGKQAEQFFQLGKLAVRDGDAIADGGGSELLPLQQNLENRAFVLSGQHGGARRQFLQRLFLAVDLQRREDRLGCDQIGNRHGAFRGEFSRQVTRWASDQRRQEDGQKAGTTWVQLRGFYSNARPVPTPTKRVPALPFWGRGP